MKQLLLVILSLCFVLKSEAQDKKTKPDLPDLKKCMQATVEQLPLYVSNLKDHAQEHDVNSMVLDLETYIDSLPKNRKYSDRLLVKYFDAIRHFLLTTTNKTTIASSFLYVGTAHQFCLYNDTALTLYIKALKDGEMYNLAKITEKRAIKSAFENCLLPALKAIDEFKPGEIKYIAFSIYYGCKDTREGAATQPVIPYCLTLVASLGDIQQYEDGLITTKGLLANAELYISNEGQRGDFRKIQPELE